MGNPEKQQTKRIAATGNLKKCSSTKYTRFVGVITGHAGNISLVLSASSIVGVAAEVNPVCAIVLSSIHTLHCTRAVMSCIL